MWSKIVRRGEEEGKRRRKMELCRRRKMRRKGELEGWMRKEKGGE